MMKKNLFKNNSHLVSYAVIGIIAVVCSVLALTDNSAFMVGGYPHLLTQITIAVILAVSLGMVVGFLGELSLGHAGFMCIGAFIGGKIAAVMEPALGNNVGTLLIAVLVGGVVAMLFGVIIGLPALRLRGDYLAIVTLAFGEIVRTLVMRMPDSLFGGTLGLETPRFNKKYLFIIAFAFVFITLIVANNLMRSKHGRAIKSIRDNEIAARAMGVNVTKYKLFVFALSAFFAGIAGALFSYSTSHVQSMQFDYNYSIEILVMVVLGGIGSINGSIIAATLITFLNVQLQTLLTGDNAVLQNVFYALILIVIVIYNNAPALKTFRERFNLKALFAKKKKSKEIKEGE